MSVTARRPWTLLLASAVAAGGLLACHPNPKITVRVSRPECPRDFVLVPIDTALYVRHVIAASGPITMVPEYHDCQRFLDTTATSFGTMVAIFASSGLDSVADPPPGPYSPTNVAITGRDSKAAATILSYDDHYAPLRIQRGINCLYMSTTNGVWRAVIHRVESDSVCLQPYDQASGGSELAVTVAPGPDGDRVPAAARWDWDNVAKEHYIGIRCGSRWCEVYNPSRQRVNSSPFYAGTVRMAVKGWYDEQNLAIPGNGGGLVPGGITGTIFPVGNLENNTEPMFSKTWKEVAMVALSGDAPAYLSKMNLISGPAPDGKSQVFFCMGRREECEIPSTESVKACDNEADPWWAKIVSNGTPKYLCVIRRKHTGVPIPGATRWRWQETDEVMWVRCPQGCCEIT